MKALPEMRESLALESAEVAGGIRASDALWLIEISDDCHLAEDLGCWPTNSESESAYFLMPGNMVKKRLIRKKMIVNDCK
jgi:hypothetical protein